MVNLASSTRDRVRLLSQATDLLEQLDFAQFDPRRQIDLLLVLAHVTLARNDQATVYALDALPLVKELQAWRNLSKPTEIHCALLQSSYAGSSQVARLGLLLFEVGAL